MKATIVRRPPDAGRSNVVDRRSVSTRLAAGVAALALIALGIVPVLAQQGSSTGPTPPALTGAPGRLAELTGAALVVETPEPSETADPLETPDTSETPEPAATPASGLTTAPAAGACTQDEQGEQLDSQANGSDPADEADQGDQNDECDQTGQQGDQSEAKDEQGDQSDQQGKQNNPSGTTTSKPTTKHDQGHGQDAEHADETGGSGGQDNSVGDGGD
jgi:hypothetical protein